MGWRPSCGPPTKLVIRLAAPATSLTCWFAPVTDGMALPGMKDSLESGQNRVAGTARWAGARIGVDFGLVRGCFGGWWWLRGS